MSEPLDHPTRPRIRLELPFTAADALKVLLAISVVLFAISLSLSVAEELGWERLSDRAGSLLDTDSERSAANWFSSCLLLLCGLLALAAATRSRRFAAWALMAVIFVAMSADEMMVVHEEIGARIQDALDTGGLLRFGFVIPGAVAVVGVIVLFAPLIKSLPAPTRTSFLLGAALYFGGALVLEALGGLAFDTAGRDSQTYAVVVNIEELFEMAGTSLLVYALATQSMASLPEPS